VTYTVASLLGVAAAVFADVVVLRTRLVTRLVWWVTYAIVLGFQLLANGVFSRLGVIVYDPDAVLAEATVELVGHGRLVYAPVEDIPFGFAMVLLTLSTWVWLGRRGVQPEPTAGPPRVAWPGYRRAR